MTPRHLDPSLGSVQVAPTASGPTLETVVLRAGKFDIGQRSRARGLGVVHGIRANRCSSANHLCRRVASCTCSGAPPVLLLTAIRMTSPARAIRSDGEGTARGRRACETRCIPGGKHGPDFGAEGKPNPSWPDYFGEMVAWLDQHLRMVTAGDAARQKPAWQPASD